MANGQKGRKASSWGLPGFWHEVRGVRNIFEDSKDIDLPKPQRFDKAIILVPGFLAIPRPYFSLAKFFNEMGYGVYFPDFGGTNTLDRQTGVLAMQRVLAEAKKRFSSIILVGHSLGGIQSLRFAQDPAVELVITIGSPMVYGTPWRLLGKLVLACLATRGIIARSIAYFDLEESVQETMLEDIVDAAKPYAQKIYSIALSTDPVAPPTHAIFPGGSHHVVVRADMRALRALSERDRGYWSHGGMVNLPEIRQVLEDILE
jgi:esterase/lipase